MKPEKLIIPPYTLYDFQRSITKLQNQVTYGCGNHGCIIKQPEGMGLNAGCRCHPYRIAHDLRQLAAAVEQAGTSWTT